MCTTIDDQGRVCVEVTREDGTHEAIDLNYTSKAAQILRNVTAHQSAVWTPENGWTS